MSTTDRMWFESTASYFREKEETVPIVPPTLRQQYSCSPGLPESGFVISVVTDRPNRHGDLPTRAGCAVTIEGGRPALPARLRNSNE